MPSNEAMKNKFNPTLKEQTLRENTGVDAVHISSDATLILPAYQKSILQCCCGCGLWHEIKVKRVEGGKLHLRFIRFEGDPDWDKYAVETFVNTDDWVTAPFVEEKKE